MLPYILTEDTLTVVFPDGTKTIDVSTPTWGDALDALKDKDFETLEVLMTLETAITAYSKGKVDISDGVIKYQGTTVHNSMTQRILRMMEDGFDIDPMVSFLENMMNNPSKKSIDNLYRFMEHNQLPITTDGCFLAYKNVNDNYKDHHSGKFDNSIGATCEMPRRDVEDDPDVTCSSGLHFCSIEYLNGMWGHRGHTMVVKINPADVVSIPTDYNNAKGRCSKYIVIDEHTDGPKDTLSESSVYECEWCDTCYNTDECEWCDTYDLYEGGYKHALSFM